MIAEKQYNMTPKRKGLVKKIARRSYMSFSNIFVKLHSGRIVKALANVLKQEFKAISSHRDLSVLTGDCEDIKTFSWEKIWLEFQRFMPQFVSLLTAVSPNSTRPMICTILSMLLKSKHQRMGYLQKIISVLLYANRAHKQVMSFSK